MNAYNAIAIHTVLDSYPIESIHETKKPFETKRWKIGGATVSLNEIENGTLRPQIEISRAHGAGLRGPERPAFATRCLQRGEFRVAGCQRFHRLAAAG